MPKQFKLYQAFHGGLNNSADPRDIADNEVSDISNMMVDQVGRIRTMGSLVASDHITGTEANGTSLTSGSGLFTFKADYDLDGSLSSAATNSAGFVLFTTATHGFAVGDYVLHWDFSVAAYNGLRRISTTPAGTTYQEESAYVSDSSGYVLNLTKSNTLADRVYAILSKGAESVSLWKHTLWADYFCGKTDIYPFRAYYIDNGLRISCLNPSVGNYKRWFGFINRTHFIGLTDACTFSGWACFPFNKLIKPSMGIVYYVSESTGVATADAASSQTALVNTLTNQYYGSDAYVLNHIAVGIVDTKARAIATQSAANPYSLYTEDYLAEAWDGHTYLIFPPEFGSSNTFEGFTFKGGGFNVGCSLVSANGTWDGTLTYEFAETFIYDGCQETLPFKMWGTATGASANRNMTVTVTACNYEGRITGGRIYYRRQNGDGLWRLLADIDLERGIRKDLQETYTGWTYQAGTGSAVTNSKFNYATLQIPDPSALLYEDINGYKQDEISLSCIGNDYTVLNRRAFACGIYVLADSSAQSWYYYDRIMYTPPNKFDTFPTSYYLEVGINDGDQFIALQGFGDRLLAFKKNALYVINISQGNDTGWYLESKHDFLGVQQPGNTFSCDRGVVWVNDNGCFFYDGNEIKNLISNPNRSNPLRAVSVNWRGNTGEYMLYGATWASFITSDAIVGINPSTNQIIVVGDTNATAGTTYIYDMTTGAWSKGTPFALASVNDAWTNFAMCENLLTVSRFVYSTGLWTTYQWSDTQASCAQYITLKDEDFGDPTILKRVYGVTVTYKASTAQNMNALLTYATDGSTDFSGSSSNIPTTQVDLSAQWANIKINFTAPVQCQSIRLKLSHTTGTMEINDVGIEYRPIHKRVT